MIFRAFPCRSFSSVPRFTTGGLGGVRTLPAGPGPYGRSRQGHATSAQWSPDRGTSLVASAQTPKKGPAATSGRGKTLMGGHKNAGWLCHEGSFKNDVWQPALFHVSKVGATEPAGTTQAAEVEDGHDLRIVTYKELISFAQQVGIPRGLDPIREGKNLAVLAREAHYDCAKSRHLSPSEWIRLSEENGRDPECTPKLMYETPLDQGRHVVQYFSEKHLQALFESILRGQPIPVSAFFTHAIAWSSREVRRNLAIPKRYMPDCSYAVVYRLKNPAKVIVSQVGPQKESDSEGPDGVKKPGEVLQGGGMQILGADRTGFAGELRVTKVAKLPKERAPRITAMLR